MMPQHTTASLPSATMAEVITTEAERLEADEELLQRLVVIGATLQRHGRFRSTQSLGATIAGLGSAELRLVRATLRHVYHLAHAEGLDLTGPSHVVTA